MVVVESSKIPRVTLPPPNQRGYRVALHPDVNGSNNATVLLVDFEPNGSTSLHTHDGDEIIYVVEGDGEAVEIKGGAKSVTPISKGSIIYAPAGQEHQVMNSANSKMTIYCVFVPPLKPSKQAEAAFKRAREYFSQKM
ncbi:MAG: cupin domain-containing protein [Nitrososphaeria archaeon]